MRGGEPIALAVHPALELGRVIQVEAIEEGTAVQRDGAIGRARAERLLEGDHVTLDRRGVELELVAGGEDRLRAQCLAQGMDRLVEEPASRLALTLGPEPGHELVAAHRARTGAGEQG